MTRQVDIGLANLVPPNNRVLNIGDSGPPGRVSPSPSLLSNVVLCSKAIRHVSCLDNRVPINHNTTVHQYRPQLSSLINTRTSQDSRVRISNRQDLHPKEDATDADRTSTTLVPAPSRQKPKP